jgi:hypothetical protein
MASPHARSTAATALITAVYYDTYLTNEPDEAFRLTNVSDAQVDLSDWIVTDGEGTFALNGSLPAGASIWVAAEAVSFTQEFGFAPDYEYRADTNPAIPKLAMPGSFVLANSGDEIVLKNDAEPEMDCVAYEDADLTTYEWSGPALEPYGGTGVGIERFALLGPDEEEGFGIEGQILYCKLDRATGLPVPDTDTIAYWAQDPDDSANGKRAMYAGWDLGRYFFTKTFTETTRLTYAIPPDHICEAARQSHQPCVWSVGRSLATFRWAARQPG